MDPAVDYRQKFFNSDRAMRDRYINAVNTRPGSDRENISADDRRDSLMYTLRMDLPTIPNAGDSLVDEDTDNGLKMQYLTSRDVNVFKTHLTEPTQLANSDEEYHLRTRPISSRPRDLPRIDDRFTLVNYTTRDLPADKQNIVPKFDKYSSFPPLVERRKELPNIDRVEYQMVKLSQGPYDPSRYISSDSWTRGGRDSRQ